MLPGNSPVFIGLDDFTINCLSEKLYTRVRSLPIRVRTSVALDVTRHFTNEPGIIGWPILSPKTEGQRNRRFVYGETCLRSLNTSAAVPDPVILSAVTASRSDTVTESKDFFAACSTVNWDWHSHGAREVHRKNSLRYLLRIHRV